MNRPALVLLTVLVVCLTSRAQAATQAGVAAAIQGAVSIVHGSQPKRSVQNGDPIFVGDRVETGPKGLLQILLMDETVFTAGPGSSLTIDDFVYDAGTSEGKVDATLAKGVFRFISGRIAARDPDAVQLEIPAGTIGIRGTIVLLRIRPTPDESFVILSGPGTDNNAGMQPGKLRIRAGSKMYEVARTGFGVTLGGLGQVLSKPFKIPQEWYDEFSFNAVTLELDARSRDAEAPLQSDGSTSEESQAGQGTARADLESTGEVDLLTQVDTFDQLVGEGPIENLLKNNGLTAIADLATLAGTFQGAFRFDAPRTALNGGTGQVDLLIDLDFSAQQLVFQVSNLSSNLLGTSGTGFGSAVLPFGAGLEGSAIYLGNLQYVEPSSACAAGCPSAFDIRLFDLNGLPGGALDADVSFSNGAASESATLRQLPATVLGGL